MVWSRHRCDLQLRAEQAFRAAYGGLSTREPARAARLLTRGTLFERDLAVQGGLHRGPAQQHQAGRDIVTMDDRECTNAPRAGIAPSAKILGEMGTHVRHAAVNDADMLQLVQ